MCGIGGLLYPDGVTAPPPADTAARLTAMNDAMAHRGPDGDGTWVADTGRVGLAHRRLAIVDLSRDAAQPMTDAEKRIHLTFNGEIYNHLVLRKTLEQAGHRFRTDHSDTEVIVHGFKEWGLEGLVSRMEGMFAFALWDKETGTLSLARDRVGIKPLYFSRAGGIFRFASEIKALMTDETVPRDADPLALNHFLSFMVAPAPLTMFRGVYKLPAAYVMEVAADGRMSARRYWDAVPGRGIDPKETKGLSDQALKDFYVSGIRSRLTAAIEKRMMADVPFGVFLSGGIDSSANVALMSRVSDRPVETFTVGFKDHQGLNELDYARRVATEFQTNHHEVLIDERDMLGYLGDLVHHQDEPIADWVCVPLHFVSKLAREKGVIVVQVGEGADEQFCGYDSWMSYLHAYRKHWNTLDTFTPRFLGDTAARFAPAERGGRAQVFEALLRAGRGHELFWSGANAYWNVHKERLLNPAALADARLDPELDGIGFELMGLGAADSGAVVSGFYDGFDRDHPGRDRLTRMAYSEFRLRLPELLLMRVDKIGMGVSIEGRVPFLDHDLVEFTMDIPEAWKVRGGERKYLEKRAAAGLVPDDIIHRPKMGFAAPVAEWLRGEFGGHAEDTVTKSRLLERGWLDKGWIEARFREHRNGRADHALHLWTLFNLAAWHDYWVG